MYTQRGQEQIVDNDIEEGIHGTGKWLRMHADMEHEAENGVCIEWCRGYWLVGGVVMVETLDSALELVA